MGAAERSHVERGKPTTSHGEQKPEFSLPVTKSLPTDLGHPSISPPTQPNGDDHNDCGDANGKTTTGGPPVSPPLTKKDCQWLAEQFVKRFLRGFSNGVGLYAGVRVVTALLRNPFRESVPLISQGVVSRDCAAVAGFLGLCPSVYHLLVELLARFRGCRDGWTYGIAGGIGGLTVALLDPSRRQTLAFFTLSRALGAAVSTLVTRGHLTHVPFFEVGVFSACVSLIVYCTAMAPQYLSRGYYRSILKWSRDYTDARLSRAFRVPGPRFLTCAEIGLHEGSCTRHRLKDLLESLAGFAKLYLPIHLTPILVFKRALFVERPLYVLGSLAKNLALSTSFLGLMVFLAKLTICVLRNAHRRPPPLPSYIPALAGAVCGLALLLERFSRRKELALFVIPHVLNILYVAGRDSRFLSPASRIPHGFTLVFALSMTSVMHAYEREPDSLTLLINGILRFFFGPSSSSVRRRFKLGSGSQNKSGLGSNLNDVPDGSSGSMENVGNAPGFKPPVIGDTQNSVNGFEAVVASDTENKHTVVGSCG